MAYTPSSRAAPQSSAAPQQRSQAQPSRPTHSRPPPHAAGVSAYDGYADDSDTYGAQRSSSQQSSQAPRTQQSSQPRTANSQQPQQSQAQQQQQQPAKSAGSDPLTDLLGHQPSDFERERYRNDPSVYDPVATSPAEPPPSNQRKTPGLGLPVITQTGLGWAPTTYQQTSSAIKPWVGGVRHWSTHTMELVGMRSVSVSRVPSNVARGFMPDGSADSVHDSNEYLSALYAQMFGVSYGNSGDPQRISPLLSVCTSA